MEFVSRTFSQLFSKQYTHDFCVLTSPRLNRGSIFSPRTTWPHVIGALIIFFFFFFLSSYIFHMENANFQLDYSSRMHVPLPVIVTM